MKKCNANINVIGFNFKYQLSQMFLLKFLITVITIDANETTLDIKSKYRPVKLICIVLFKKFKFFEEKCTEKYWNLAFWLALVFWFHEVEISSEALEDTYDITRISRRMKQKSPFYLYLISYRSCLGETIDKLKGKYVA